MKSEVSEAITDEEILEAVVNHRNRLIQEKTRLIKELGTTKPAESEEVYAVALDLHHDYETSLGLKRSPESTDCLPLVFMLVKETTK